MSNINHANRIAREKMRLAAQKGAMTDTKRELQEIGLSERQWTLLSTFLAGNSVEASALAAGYSPNSFHAVFRSSSMQKAMAVMLDRFMVGHLAPEALRQLNKMLVADKTPEGVKTSIAFGLLDRAGFSAKRHEKQAGVLQDVSAMSQDELRQAINTLDREMSARMVNVTPNSEPMTSDELDMYS